MADNKIVACSLTLEEINSLAETVKKNELQKIKIKNGDCEIVIEAEKKFTSAQLQQANAMGMQPMVNVTAAAASSPKTEVSAVIKEELKGNVVKSPIVGTFYSSPSPDKPPFVKIGDKVKKGDVIMIIESMKLMNEVQSEFDGIVAKILVESGQAVEFDQPIMIIE